MKKLLILLFSLFLFSSPSIFADEILKIEGISLEDGQSILELFQKGEVTIDDLNALSLKAEEEAAERKKIADAKNMKKAAERKRIADAKKIDSDTKSMKTCYSCKEEIKVDAHVCKHCGSLQDTEENREASRRNNRKYNMYAIYLPTILWVIFWTFIAHIFGLIDIFDIIDSVFDYLYWTLWHDFYYEYIAS